MNLRSLSALLATVFFAGCAPGTYLTVDQNPRVGRGLTGFADVPVTSWYVSETACNSESCNGLFNGHPARFYFETRRAVAWGSRGEWVYGGRVAACDMVWYVVYERQALTRPSARRAIKKASTACGYHGTGRNDGGQQSDSTDAVPTYISVPDSSNSLR